MELTSEQRAILAHVVIDPDAWVAYAIEHVGEVAVTAKIERWREAYLSAKDLPGYMSRVERDAYRTPEQIAVEAVEAAARIAEAAKIEAKKQAIIDNLPSWAAIETAINGADTVAKLRAITLKLARIVYWLAKDKAD